MENTDDWPIFILSLHDATDRREPLMRSLEQMGFDYEVIYGVDGRQSLPQWAEQSIVRRRSRWGARPMTDGEFGCALSHAKAYRMIIERDLPGAIIFEDDARIEQGFKEFIEVNGHKKGDMVLLGHRMCWVEQRSQIKLSAELSLFRVKIRPHLAHAYVISRASAQKILSIATPVREPADWPCDISEFGTYALEPQLAYQKRLDFAHSHLEKDRQNILTNQRHFLITHKRWRKILKRLQLSYWIKKQEKKRYKRLS